MLTDDNLRDLYKGLHENNINTNYFDTLDIIYEEIFSENEGLYFLGGCKNGRYSIRGVLIKEDDRGSVTYLGVGSATINDSGFLEFLENGTYYNKYELDKYKRKETLFSTKVN